MNGGSSFGLLMGVKRVQWLVKRASTRMSVRSISEISSFYYLKIYYLCRL